MKNPVDVWRERNNPFRELKKVRDEFDRVFDDMLPQFSNGTSLIDSAAAFNPSCDIREDKTNYYLKFDMPGMKKDQIKVEMSDGMLTVSAERKDEKTKESARQYRSEVFYGSYSRSLKIPTSVDEKKVDAQYVDGVLSVTLPKTEATQVKQIPVQ